jgi:hypothetical protein
VLGSKHSSSSRRNAYLTIIYLGIEKDASLVSTDDAIIRKEMQMTGRIRQRQEFVNERYALKPKRDLPISLKRFTFQTVPRF